MRERIIYDGGASSGSATRGARVGAAAPPPPSNRRRCAFYGGGRAPPRAGVRGCGWSSPRCALAAWWRTKIRPELSEGPLQCARERRAGSPQWLPHARRRFFDLILSYHRGALSWLHIYMRVPARRRFCKFRSRDFSLQRPRAVRYTYKTASVSLITNREKHPAALCVSPEHISQGHLRARFAKGEGCAGTLRSVTNRTQIALS